MAVVLLFLLPLIADSSAKQIRRAPVGDNAVATLENSNEIFLEVLAAEKDSYVSLAVQYAGSEREWAALERANDARSVRPGLFYAIPFDVLTGDYRARAVDALFPGDGPGERGWVHRVPEGDEGQTLETIALWFTGDTSLADDLAESNGIDWVPLLTGAEVVIPTSILAVEYKEAMKRFPPVEPVTAPVADTPSVRRKPDEPVIVGDLRFVDDEKGGYAVYRLKRGEALYSAVIVKYTGRLDPDEVAGMTKKVVKLSGIKNVKSIPVGHRVLIPREFILPEYLPPGDPVRIAWESGLAATRRHRISTSARDLDGVVLILDAGHGGDDIGAQRNGVHEDDYVYDIMCRIKALAEKTTGAQVLTTIRDKSSGYRPLEGPFRIDKDEYLLTTPHYHPRKPHARTAGVNLRWYLVNSYFRSAIARGVEQERIVFVSIHADSLHPSVRGAMVYVPGQAYRRQTYGHKGRLYRRKEVSELRYVKFSRKERERSEGLSRRLANKMIESFRRAGLPVHAHEPVRDHVIRRRRRWTPAVIRTSLVPQSLLLEVVNLNNQKDSRLIKDPDFRQKVAETVLDTLRRHYAGSGAAPLSSARSAP